MAKLSKSMVQKKALEEEIIKQINRINRFIKRKTKEGYTFDVTDLPEKPTYRHSVSTWEERLKEFKSLKANKLYYYSTYTEESGEVVTGREKQKRKKEERKKQKRKKQPPTTPTIPPTPKLPKDALPSEYEQAYFRLHDLVERASIEKIWIGGFDHSPFFNTALSVLEDNESYADNVNEFYKNIRDNISELDSCIDMMYDSKQETCESALDRFIYIINNAAESSGYSAMSTDDADYIQDIKDRFFYE